jgi:hypothetical protein
VGLGDEVVAHHARGPAIRRRQRREHAHQRGLSGAVRPQDPEDQAARHIEIDAVDRAHIPEVLDEAAGADRGRRPAIREVCGEALRSHGHSCAAPALPGPQIITARASGATPAAHAG